jgi:hypothetical protein
VLDREVLFELLNHFVYLHELVYLGGQLDVNILIDASNRLQG